MLGAGWAFPPRILVVLRIGGDVGFGVAAAANIMQDCTAVPFGSCTLTEQHQSVSCRSCLRPSQPRVVHASVDVEMPHEHITCTSRCYHTQALAPSRGCLPHRRRQPPFAR